MPRFSAPKLSILVMILFSLISCTTSNATIAGLNDAQRNAVKHVPSIDFMLGQKQMLDIRYFCDDGTPSESCRTPVTELPDALAGLISQQQIGGIILFAENLESVTQITKLNKQLQDTAVGNGLPPLFIAIDQEGGRVSRLPNGVGNAFAGNMAIGATYAQHKTDFADKVNAVIAQQVRALGFNVNFAPTVDVNVNPDNPVINVRAYGESPKMVATLGIASVKAMQSRGVISAMKHFPGHGDTHVDSHTGLPMVKHSRAQIDAVDLFPFATAITQGGIASPAMIMTAHIQYPQLDSTQFLATDGSHQILPATLSRKILTGVLRDELKYTGLIVTDALDMAGIAHYMNEGQAMLRTFYAGADIALMPYTIRNAEDIRQYQAMMSEIKTKVLTRDQTNAEKIPSITQLEESTQRILATKQQYINSQAITGESQYMVNGDELEKQLARAAITSVIGEKTLQLGSQQRIGLVMPDRARCDAFGSAMQQQAFVNTQCLSLAQAQSDETLKSFVASIDTLIVGDITPQHSVVEMGGMDDLARWQDRANKEQQLAQMHALLTAATMQNKQRVFIALRAPYVIDEYRGMIDTAIVTYDYRVSLDHSGKSRGVMFDVLAEWLAGKFIATGALPVSVGATSAKLD